MAPDFNSGIRTAIKFKLIERFLLFIAGFFGFSRGCFSGGFFLLTFSGCAGFGGGFSAFFNRFLFNDLDYLDGNSGHDYARFVNDVDVF